MRHRVNRFTFDTHSVVLFSALVLSGAVSAGNSATARNAQLSPVSVSSVASHTARPAAGHSVLHRASTAWPVSKASEQPEH